MNTAEGFAVYDYKAHRSDKDLRLMNTAEVFAVYDYKAWVFMNTAEAFAIYDYKAHRSDELDFGVGAKLTVLRRGDDFEKEWWWCKVNAEREGYVPRNLLGLYPRVTPLFTLNVPEHHQDQSKKTSDDEDVAMSS